jgi:F-type H+-transporting ATPase subunit b
MRKLMRWNILLLLLALFALWIAAPAVLATEEGNQGEETTAEVVEEAPAEEASGLAAFGINTGFLIAQIINFLFIMTLLTVILWKPIVNMLDRRQLEIQKGLEDAAAAANARQNAEAEAEKILAQARSEALQIVVEGRTRGEDIAKNVEAEARREAESIRETARTEAQAARNAELAGLRGQVAAISMAVAQRLIGETLDEKRQRALIDDFFSKVPADARSMSGDVEVVSAMPLNNDEQEKVRRQIGADEVNFVVDPSILGGLIVRSEDRVVDGSVRRGLTDLGDRLR